MEIKVLEFNTINRNGRLYTEECIDDCLKRQKDSIIPFYERFNCDSQELENKLGEGTIYKEGNYLCYHVDDDKISGEYLVPTMYLPKEYEIIDGVETVNYIEMVGMSLAEDSAFFTEPNIKSIGPS